MVHLQHGVVHRQPLDTGFEFIVKHPARIIETLVVDPHRQHEMPEQLVGDAPAPRHLLPDRQRTAHVFQIKIARIVGNVPHGHIGIEKRHCIAFLRRHRPIKHPEQIASGQQFPLMPEIGLHTLHEPAVGGRASRQQARKHQQACQ